MSEWAIERTTTDKLEGYLNSLEDRGAEIFQVAFTGGRDWVIIYIIEDDTIAVRSTTTSDREPGRVVAFKENI